MKEKIEAKEKMSFTDIFHNEGHEILIPSIQRDYVQGRPTERETKIRKDFVRQLKQYILSGQSHSLNFIYGSEENSHFIPLDGQQRLTTLWLLHVYLICASSINRDENKNCKKKCDLFRFSYQTRDSSSRFCRKLLSEGKNVLTNENLSQKIEIKDSKLKRKIRPSELIQNEGWWFTSWNEDPTVSGMLTMLDEIDKVFFDVVDEAFTDLFLKDTKPVVFEFLPLKGFHDIDDLYIKMNARGLPLTQYEIFKSKIIEDFENILPEEEKSFKANIDVNWSDTLWKLRGKNERNIDKFLQHTFIVLLANEGVLSTDNNNISSNLDYLFEANDKRVTFAYKWYEEKGIVFNAELLKRLNTDLTLLLDSKETPFNADGFRNYDNFWFDIQKAVRRWILEGKDIEGDQNLSYPTRLKLHAFLKFRHKLPTSSLEDLSEWMRLIHNLSEASRINDSSKMVQALKGVENMIENYLTWRKVSIEKNSAQDLTINEWVASSLSYRPVFMNNDQWQEEVIKAQLRRNQLWREEIDRAERHPYLKGQIGVTLWLAGIIPSQTPFADLESIPDLTPFKEYLDKAYPLFQKLGDAQSAEIKDMLMVSAMLSKGSYMPWSSAGRKNFYNIPNHRDYSWKNLFSITGSSANGTALECLKGILDDPYFSASDISRSLKSIHSNHEPENNWRGVLLGKYGVNLMKLAKKGFIAFDGENTLIYGQSRRSHYHSEIMSRLLFEILKDKYSLSGQYIEVKSHEEDSRIEINGLSICHWDKTWQVRKENKLYEYSSMEDVIPVILNPQLLITTI